MKKKDYAVIIDIDDFFSVLNELVMLWKRWQK